MLPSTEIENVLGTEENDILRAIRTYPGDVDSIHVLTGIPRPCIEVKVAALVNLGYVMRTPEGYKAIDVAVKRNATRHETGQHASDAGFFANIISRVERVVTGCIAPGSIITVKRVKKLLGIPCNDRSKTAFIARALQELVRRGLLETLSGDAPCKYRRYPDKGRTRSVLP